MHLSILSAFFSTVALVSCHPVSDIEASGGAKALYFIDNKVSNNVVSLPVNGSGRIVGARITPTGGKGAIYRVAHTTDPVDRDTTESQDAVVTAGNFLYVVNPGSDTISSFAIDPEEPAKLTLLEAPTQLAGQFPVTIAVSEKLGLLCTGTSSAHIGVECFKRSANGKLKPDGVGLRALGEFSHTPPEESDTTISDMFFSPDDTRLYTIVKNPGRVAVYPMVNGTASTKPVLSHPAGTILFGGFAVPNTTNIWVSDFGLGGGYVFDVKKNLTAELVGSGTSAKPYFNGTCWAQYSDVTKSVWVTGTANGDLLSMDLSDGHLRHEASVYNPNNGTLDIVVPNKYLYGLAPGLEFHSKAAVVVVDISNEAAPKTVQYFEIGHGINQRAHGLAYWA